MNDLERFEMEAETFHRITGFLRPGKDQPAEMTHPTPAERQTAWDSYFEMRRFRNFLCILRELDYADVKQAVARDDWGDFLGNPHRWFIQASSRQQWVLWQAMEKRMAR